MRSSFRRIALEIFVTLAGGTFIFAAVEGSTLLFEKIKAKQTESVSVGEAVRDLKLPLEPADKLLVAVSASCPYSKKSLSLYERLIPASAQVGIPTYLVVPDDTSKSFYQESLNLPAARVIKADLGRAGITHTPTLLLLDSNNRVKRQWVGQIPDSLEDATIARITSSAHFISRPDPKAIQIVSFSDNSAQPGAEPTRKISHADNLMSKASENVPSPIPTGIITDSSLRNVMSEAIVINIAPREQFGLAKNKGEINIPEDELAVRGVYELDPARVTLIDCGVTDATKCDMAGFVLSNIGIKQLYLLDRGANGLFCKATTTR